MTEQSYIGHNSKGEAVSFVGKEAVDTYRLGLLISGIKMHMRCGMIPTRGLTITRMFAIAHSYTGKHYKRGQHQRAIDELQVILDYAKNSIKHKTI